MSKNSNSQRKILITAALPYANGEIHLGHLAEHMSVDFWARFQKMRGHECLAICGDDTHGTPIMLRARSEGITPEQLIAQSYKSHTSDFNDFQIYYDHYASTHSDANKELCYYFYDRIKEQGHIESRSIEQLYCEHDKMFLPDRFVKGVCPKCDSNDQNGDSCDKCGATYNPVDLKQAYCVHCRNKPVLKSSEHLFFKLQNFQSFLKEWIPTHCSPEIQNKMQEWLSEDLKDWDISRDAPYFGFEIPGKPGKFFYVWVDAPMGYISITELWCRLNHKKLADYWQNPDCEIYHCVGKDIAYFHCLFWPAFLKAAGFNTPTQVFVHGFVTVNGHKMSKSRGNYISARGYLDKLSAEYLRYYYACKLQPGIDDFDFSTEDFVARVNADLVGKITNLASRSAQMLEKNLDATLCAVPASAQELIQFAQNLGEEIAEFYETRNFAKALLLIRDIADAANKYFDQHAPWKLIKEDPEATRAVLTSVLNVFRIISIYLKPVLPLYTQKVEKLFNAKAPYQWADVQTLIEKQKIQPFEHLIERVPEKVALGLVASPETINPETARTEAVQKKPAKESKVQNSLEATEQKYISIDEFNKVDLRVGKIIAAENIPEANKLLKLSVDLGDHSRTIFSGIKAAYTAEQMLGKLVVVVSNLAPRKMKFGISEGMILASGDGDAIKLASVEAGAKVGDRIS
ncbi:MAG: methionine--tRNA ligase [Oligoflexales bacterium]|nr:methionine--tRNA ligase [Oligoflexales bacterium]